MTIKRLKELINITHKHGVQLKAEIAWYLRVRPFGWRTKVATRKVILRGLEALNRRRHRELAEKEPHPTPQAQFTMYDAADGGTGLPTNHPAAVAGYVDGHYRSYNQLVKRFPHAKHLSIAVFPQNDARCLDIETGDATPSQAPAWVRRQHARGIRRPIVYANTSTMPQVLAALANDHIKRSEYLVWTAHYTWVDHIEPGSDATQWANVEVPGKNYDVSRCQPWFL